MQPDIQDRWKQLSADGKTWEMTAGDGYRWLIRPSETTTNQFALFRLAPGKNLPRRSSIAVLSVEEEYGYGIFRSPAEAKVMSSLLSRPSGGTEAGASTLGALGWKENASSGKRRWWEIDLPEGLASLFLGSDEDPRDVLLQFRFAGEGMIRTGFFITHNSRGNVVEGPEGASLHAGAEFISLLKTSNHLLEPLREDDWLSYSQGRGIEPLPVTEFTPPVARRFAMTYLAAMRGTDMESMKAILRDAHDIQGNGPIEGFDAEVGTIIVTLVGADKPEAAEITDAMNRDPWLQYVVVAAAKGADEARQLAEASRTPTAGM
jgi:hypothetical protein